MKTLSPAVITLPRRQDAAERYFSTLSHLPWAMLLHSGHADHPHNRFDILVADPVMTLVTRDADTAVHDKDGITHTPDDPMTVLRSALTSLAIRPDYNPGSSLRGGALGLFGYDLGRRFEALPNVAERDITLPDMAVGIYDWALIVDHQRQTVSLLSHGDLQARRHWLESQRAPTREPFMLTSAWQSNMSRAQYGEKFRQVQRYLHSGDCYQVNLAQRFQAQYQGDEWLAFERLNQPTAPRSVRLSALRKAQSSACRQSGLFSWKIGRSRRAPSRAPCRDWTRQMPIVSRRKDWQTHLKIVLKT